MSQSKEKGSGSLYLEGSSYANIGNIVTSVDYEALIKANPDAIITYLNSPKLGEMGQKLGLEVPVIHRDSGNISEYTNIINKTGYLLEREKEASDYIAFFDEILGKYLEAMKDNRRTNGPVHI